MSDQRAGGGTLLAAVATCLALTWLNPHVYLDTLVLLGSVGSTHGDARWAFAAGAGVASILWFTALGFGARMLAPLFARPLAWRILDARHRRRDVRHRDRAWCCRSSSRSARVEVRRLQARRVSNTVAGLTSGARRSFHG